MTGLTTLESIGSLIAKSAPLLGSVLGSPLAGIGISLLSSVFGVDSADSNKLLEAIKNDPDAILKIKQLEYSHKAALLDIQSKNYATEVDDRKNARNREIVLRDHVPTFLALGFLIIYALIQIYCVTHDNSVNDIISARLQDILIMIISYYFGSAHKEWKPSH